MRENSGKKRSRATREEPGGFLAGLTDLIEKLGELAETGRELRESGEIGDDKLKAVYGLRVRVGAGGSPLGAEPFGNVEIDRKRKRAIVKEIREPMVDVMEEPDAIAVVAEMPGVTAADVSVAVEDDLMTIEAARGEKKYRKEVLLPKPVSPDNPRITCNNGIVEIRCRLK